MLWTIWLCTIYLHLWTNVGFCTKEESGKNLFHWWIDVTLRRLISRYLLLLISGMLQSKLLVTFTTTQNNQESILQVASIFVRNALGEKKIRKIDFYRTRSFFVFFLIGHFVVERSNREYDKIGSDKKKRQFIICCIFLMSLKLIHMTQMTEWLNLPWKWMIQSIDK